MNAERFVQKMKEDLNFSEKVVACQTKQQVVDEANAMGIELREEEIDEVNTLLRNERLAAIDQTTNAGRLLAKMLEDNVFAEQILGLTEVEEAIKAATRVGIPITEEDIEQANKVLGFGADSYHQTSGGELSEEDLEGVAGGTLLTSIGELIISLATSVSVTVSTIVATVSVSLVSVSLSVMNSGEIDKNRGK